MSPTPVSSPTVENQETRKPGGKGCLCFLGVIVVVMGAALFWLVSANKAGLTPQQKEELARLIGNYQGISTPELGLGNPWKRVWTVRIQKVDGDQLRCECILLVYQQPAALHRSETVDLQYDVSAKRGYVKVAGGSQEVQWGIYVETALLKSGKEIPNLVLFEPESPPCRLQRQ